MNWSTVVRTVSFVVLFALLGIELLGAIETYLGGGLVSEWAPELAFTALCLVMVSVAFFGDWLQPADAVDDGIAPWRMAVVGLLVIWGVVWAAFALLGYSRGFAITNAIVGLGALAVVGYYHRTDESS